MVFQTFLGAVNWGAVGWVLVGTLVVLVVLAAVGRAIAAAFPPNPEHVSHFRKPASPVAARWPVAAVPAAPAPAARPAAVPGAIPPEVMAVIAASVAVVLRGKNFVVTGVVPAGPAKGPDIEKLMSLWSLEGRRQVYSSHTLPR